MNKFYKKILINNLVYEINEYDLFESNYENSNDSKLINKVNINSEDTIKEVLISNSNASINLIGDLNNSNKSSVVSNMPFNKIKIYNSDNEGVQPSKQKLTSHSHSCNCWRICCTCKNDKFNMTNSSFKIYHDKIYKLLDIRSIVKYLLFIENMQNELHNKNFKNSRQQEPKNLDYISLDAASEDIIKEKD